MCSPSKFIHLSLTNFHLDNAVQTNLGCGEMYLISYFIIFCQRVFIVDREVTLLTG